MDATQRRRAEWRRTVQSGQGAVCLELIRKSEASKRYAVARRGVETNGVAAEWIRIAMELH